MKVSLFILCILFATAAFGQSSGAVGSVLNNTPSMVEFSSHDALATQHSMGREQNLLEISSYTWAQGERPLWEVAPKIYPTPLGDSARALRKEHEAAKKAEIVWNN